jgi:cytochrome c-type biogenesis protein CcmH
MNRALATCFSLALLLLAVVQVAHADPVDDATRRIGKQLQCPICAGATVADSPSDLAGQMRGVIRSKVQAGESDQQIIDYFVERYGDGVLVEPPRRGISLFVWLAPLIMLLAGALVLWRLLRGWLRPRWAPATATGILPDTVHRNGTAHAPDATPATPVDRARAELDRFRREA